MDTQTIVIAVVALCSLGGWYIVLAKYIEVRTILKERERFAHTAITNTAAPNSPVEQQFIDDNDDYEDIEYVPGKHIPGMGPAPLIDTPPFPYEEYFAHLKKPARQAEAKQYKNAAAVSQVTPVMSTQKRLVCNWATIMHLSAFIMVTGIPLLGIVVATIVWLLKKEQHPFLERHGREVINFQITLTLIQVTFLLCGTLFIWLFPYAASTLFQMTKVVHIVFASSMHLPFNLFTVIPFIWGCIMMLRGAVAAYNGLAYTYPYNQAFITAPKRVKAAPQIQVEEDTPAPVPESMRYSFG